MLKLRSYLKPFTVGILIAVVLLLIQAICDLNLPNYMAKMVDIGIVKQDTGYILTSGLIMLGFALVSGMATILVSLLSAKIAAGVSRNLRKDVFSKVSQFSNAEFDKFSTASLITRTTNDINQVQMVLMMGLRMLCYAPIMAVGGIIMALRSSVSMIWTIGVACVAMVGLILVIFAVVMPKFKVMQTFVDRLNLVSRETLTGLMVIRAFGTERFEKSRFEKANRNLADLNLFVNRAMALMMPIMMLVMNGASVLIIWVGAHKVADMSMQVGDMMAYMQYAMQIIMAFLMISMMFVFLPRASVSAGRIHEVLSTELEITDTSEPAVELPEKKGLVEFKDVAFRYEGADENVVYNLNFTAQPGETTAFIGATGSGKTTIVNLIPRFYDVTKGEILVGGVDVRKQGQEELRSHIGYVPQKNVLMSGTIKSNIAFGNENASDEEIRKAAEIAQSLEFIESKKNKFDDEIAQGGGNVSGGQKQRLAIARALAIKPDIYIFDDSFSALDFKTDAKLRKALKEYTGDSTVIIVAQRVSTIMDASKIFVVDEGKIVGEGTHEELLANCPEYHEIASSQLSEAEIKASSRNKSEESSSSSKSKKEVK
ncbi:MAG: ABC transporter ATP-binding protein [Anaerovoracaceae bacterium]